MPLSVPSTKGSEYIKNMVVSFYKYLGITKNSGDIVLFLVGSGISMDLTVKGIHALRISNQIFIETYTNAIDNKKIEEIEKNLNVKIEKIDRFQVESSYLIELAKTKTISLISSGDPLTATTHIALIKEAKEKGVGFDIIHNSSIYTAAAGLSGLQIYKFGKTASLVNPRENYKPTSSLDIIRTNLKNEMHTLVLLDTEPTPMNAETALELLSEFDSAIVLSRLGTNNEKITYGKISILKKMHLGSPPFSIVIPSNLHIFEKEYLELL